MKLLSLCMVLALAAASCQADISDETPRPKTYVSLEDFYVRNKVPVQQVQANSSNTISIQGNKGSRFTIPANAFVTQSGQPVNGNVAIEVKEILKPIDMILSNMPTMSDGRPLESGGQFFVRAVKDGEELKLAPGKQVMITVNNANSQAMQNMQVFNGVVTPDGTVNWQVSTNQANVIRPDTSGGTFHTMFSDQVGWMNIDKFYTQPQINYTVNVPNTPDINETALYVHFTGRNTICAFPRTMNGFVSNNLIAAPVTLVAMCVKDKKLYYALKAVTLQNAASTTLQLEETTEQALKERLKTLN